MGGLDLPVNLTDLKRYSLYRCNSFAQKKCARWLTERLHPAARQAEEARALFGGRGAPADQAGQGLLPRQVLRVPGPRAGDHPGQAAQRAERGGGLRAQGLAAGERAGQGHDEAPGPPHGGAGGAAGQTTSRGLAQHFWAARISVFWASLQFCALAGRWPETATESPNEAPENHINTFRRLPSPSVHVGPRCEPPCLPTARNGNGRARTADGPKRGVARPRLESHTFAQKPLA